MSDVRLKSASDNFADAHALHVVDTSRAKDGVWLVKVPKYLAELWHNAGPDGVVGKVVIASSSTASQNVNKGPGSQVTLVTDSELTYIDPIFSKLVSSPFSNKPNARYSRRLSLFGRVNSRAECRPPPNTRYMMLKAQQFPLIKYYLYLNDLFFIYTYFFLDSLSLQAYLTEILREIAVFNNHIPHKNMWELKPEYRHYTQAETKRQPNTERTT
ncbi:unnamed protein product [Trichobilharzia regenti]|nr:unnamed protein product [Trichobilharzia regenti]